MPPWPSFMIILYWVMKYNTFEERRERKDRKKDAKKDFKKKRKES